MESAVRGLEHRATGLLKPHSAAFFTRSVAEYRGGGSLRKLLIAVGRVLIKPKQVALLLEIRPLLHHNHLSAFDEEIFIWKETGMPPETSSFTEGKYLDAPFELVSSGEPHLPVAKFRSPHGLLVVAIKRKRRTTTLGFTVRRIGGAVVIDSLVPNSEAQVAGLRVGDVILAVNETRVCGLSYANASGVIAAAIGTAKKIKMILRTEKKEPRSVSTAVGGVAATAHQPRVQSPIVVLKRRSHADRLGVRITGGLPDSMTIYVTEVEPNSLADKAGLRVRTRVLEINGVSTDGMSHRNATKLICGSLRTTLRVVPPQALANGPFQPSAEHGTKSKAKATRSGATAATAAAVPTKLCTPQRARRPRGLPLSPAGADAVAGRKTKKGKHRMSKIAAILRRGRAKKSKGGAATAARVQSPPAAPRDVGDLDSVGCETPLEPWNIYHGGGSDSARMDARATKLADLRRVCASCPDPSPPEDVLARIAKLNALRASCQSVPVCNMPFDDQSRQLAWGSGTSTPRAPRPESCKPTTTFQLEATGATTESTTEPPGESASVLIDGWDSDSELDESFGANDGFESPVKVSLFGQDAVRNADEAPKIAFPTKSFKRNLGARKSFHRASLRKARTQQRSFKCGVATASTTLEMVQPSATSTPQTRVGSRRPAPADTKEEFNGFAAVFDQPDEEWENVDSSVDLVDQPSDELAAVYASIARHNEQPPAKPRSQSVMEREGGAATKPTPAAERQHDAPRVKLLSRPAEPVKAKAVTLTRQNEDRPQSCPPVKSTARPAVAIKSKLVAPARPLVPKGSSSSRPPPPQPPVPRAVAPPAVARRTIQRSVTVDSKSKPKLAPHVGPSADRDIKIAAQPPMSRIKAPTTSMVCKASPFRPPPPPPPPQSAKPIRTKPRLKVSPLRTEAAPSARPGSALAPPPPPPPPPPFMSSSAATTQRPAALSEVTNHTAVARQKPITKASPRGFLTDIKAFNRGGLAKITESDGAGPETPVPAGLTGVFHAALRARFARTYSEGAISNTSMMDNSWMSTT